MELHGRSILITGASGGIGRAVSLRLARAGANLTLVARREEPLRHLAAEIGAAHDGAHTGGTPGPALVPADVRERDGAERAVAEAVRRFGGLDAVVNGAGVGFLRRLEESDDAEIEAQIGTNLLGAYRVTRAALNELLRRPGSAIVNVASFAGRVAAPYYDFYSASKFALVGLTESWRRELGPRGIRVTLVLPAAVETPLLDRLGRDRALGSGPAGVVLRPDDVARAVARALRSHPPDIYVPATHRALAIFNVAWPSMADRVVNALFRYPPKR